MDSRFWDKVTKTDTCWLWNASKNSDGYGNFWNGSSIVRAHKYSWLLANNIIPENHVIRHKCKNKHCINPEHLETGTQKENSLDRLRDDTSARGSNNPNCKLTINQVREIRARHSEKRCDLAKEYGIGKTTVSGIINKKRWGWL